MQRSNLDPEPNITGCHGLGDVAHSAKLVGRHRREASGSARGAEHWAGGSRQRPTGKSFGADHPRHRGDRRGLNHPSRGGRGQGGGGADAIEGLRGAEGSHRHGLRWAHDHRSVAIGDLEVRTGSKTHWLWMVGFARLFGNVGVMQTLSH